MSLLIEIVLFLFAIAGSVFFAAMETALTSVPLSTWDRLRQEKRHLDTAYRLWSNDPSRVLGTILFGSTLANLAASVLASSIMRVVAHHLPMSTALFLSLASLLAGGTILIFGEILPKLYARQAQERTLIRIVPWVGPVMQTLGPFMHGLARLAERITKTLTRHPQEPLITTEELRSALSETRSEGLSTSDRRILSNIISFDRIKVSEVMIPRANVIAVGLEQNTERMFEHIVRSGFSRIPIYFGSIDNIVGIVYAKDLLVEWRSSGLVVLEDLLRPPYRIAPDAPLPVLLQGFRQGHHLAIVTDARGRTEGIVTIEDVVEVIVGDIADEFDPPQDQTMW